MSIELSLLHKGAVTSMLRKKCAPVPQTSNNVRESMTKVLKVSSNHRVRPFSLRVSISMRICPLLRCVYASPKNAIRGMTCSIQST